MRLRSSFAALTVATGLLHAGVAIANGCDGLLRPSKSSAYEISIDTSRAIRKIGPEYFGFNLEWVEFQLSLWDSPSKQVLPEVVEWLKAFPGAVYRYPGGTVANYFEWRAAIGESGIRKPQTPVVWRGPLVAEFGLPEYLNFVQSVGGKAWYVANIYGSLKLERSPAELAQEAGELASYFRTQREAGKPGIYRWELGNELDRDHFRWHPEKYSEIALGVLKNLQASDREIQAVSLAQDWPASEEKHRIEPAAYNQHLGKAFKGKTSEFATHLYYDGKPWGPPVPNMVKQHCRNSQSIQQGAGAVPTIWVTEHARNPKGTPSDSNWKENWPQSADLSAGIGVADMAIALAQDLTTKGLFVHSLHGTDGPWPLFHRRKGGGIVPSATYWSLRLLRESLLDDVLPTAVKSNNQSGYEGGYDLRAVAMTNPQRDKITVWMVNRAGKAIDVQLSLSKVVSQSRDADISILAADDASLNNYGGQTRLRPRRLTKAVVFDAQGVATLEVPAHAVMTLSMPVGGTPR